MIGPRHVMHPLASILGELDALRMDLGDEAREPHTCQQLGVDIVTLVLGLSDDSEPLGVSEHEVDASGSMYDV